MTARPLVLLHGWGLTPSVWDGLRAALPATLDVRAPALPCEPVADGGLADWSDALARGLPDGATLCGWSLGGMIALDLARRHPSKVARLVLIGTSPCFVSRIDPVAPWPCGLDVKMVDGFIENFAAHPAATLHRFVALQALGDARRRQVAAALGGALANGGERGLAHGLRLLADTDLRASLPAVAQPVDLLHGVHDALMPIAAAEWLAAQLPAARLVRFDDCGHAPFLSRPAECVALIGSAARD